MAGEDDLADVGGTPGRCFEAQADRLVEEGRVEARAALIASGPVAQAREPFGAVPADPAVERVAADRPGIASGRGVLAGDLADQETALAATEPRVQGLGDQVVPPDGECFCRVAGHRSPPSSDVPAITGEAVAGAKGEVVLGASQAPPVTRAARRQGGTRP